MFKYASEPVANDKMSERYQRLFKELSMIKLLTDDSLPARMRFASDLALSGIIDMDNQERASAFEKFTESKRIFTAIARGDDERDDVKDTARNLIGMLCIRLELEN
jgi:hypothetical protein